MAISLCEIRLSPASLAYSEPIVSSEAGAVVDFFGVVRLTEGADQLSGIDYEAHCAMAEHQLREIARAAAQKFGLLHVSIRHRAGFVPVGEASLHVRVTSGHRAEAFAASQAIVEEIKLRVPIWKHPVFVQSAEAQESVLTGAPSPSSFLAV